MHACLPEVIYTVTIKWLRWGQVVRGDDRAFTEKTERNILHLRFCNICPWVVPIPDQWSIISIIRSGLSLHIRMDQKRTKPFPMNLNTPSATTLHYWGHIRKLMDMHPEEKCVDQKTMKEVIWVKQVKPKVSKETN